MKITFLSNIPSPYRIDFFNELGKYVDLKVIFEAERNYELNEKWYNDKFENFDCVFLKKGAIQEKKINWKILKHLKRNNQDLIIVTNYSYFTELIGLLYIKLMRIPYCMEVDGGIIKNEKKILKILKKILIKGAKAYISPSKATDDFLIWYGAEKEKIFRYPFTSLKQRDLLPRCLSKDEKILIRKKLGIEEKKMILSVGQFIHRKGYDVLLRACKYISSDIGVYIIGGQATEEYIKIKNELGLKNVKFLSFKDRENLKMYYKAADLFVLPTREDIWGLVINEAMGQGLPIVTTEKCVAGVELVEDSLNGYIIPIENIIELSRTINKSIISDGECYRMGTLSLKKINEYTIENMCKVHLNILKTIINEKYNN